MGPFPLESRSLYLLSNLRYCRVRVGEGTCPSIRHALMLITPVPVARTCVTTLDSTRGFRINSTREIPLTLKSVRVSRRSKPTRRRASPVLWAEDERMWMKPEAPGFICPTQESQMASSAPWSSVHDVTRASANMFATNLHHFVVSSVLKDLVDTRLDLILPHLGRDRFCLQMREHRSPLLSRVLDHFSQMMGLRRIRPTK